MLHARSVKSREEVIVMLDPNVVLQRCHNVVTTLSKNWHGLPNMYNMADYLEQIKYRNVFNRKTIAG